jgi:cytochrome c oxidase subunit 2
MPAQFFFALFFALLVAVPTLAYGGMQSAFDAKGKDAAQILEITWVLFIGGGLIFIVVMVLALIALFGPPAMRAALGRHAWVIGGGIAFPVVVLSALLIYTFLAASSMVRAQSPPAARIEVTGELWWWRVKYLDASGKTILETANEIRIPAGQPVDLKLISNNVIHSFWVPNLAGKIDMIPGHVNQLRVQADAPGIFRGQCAEYCGAQHAKMAFYVVAQTIEEYSAWLAAQIQPAVTSSNQLLQQGQELFFNNHCSLCHTIRGTPATGNLGPDLTHLGSRLSIAAGILPNGQGPIAGWITDSQQIKPGNRMPSFNQFSGEELRALSAYMESLQ